jgi:hypothetical protein
LAFPEILDVVDVFFTVGKQLGMIDPQMPEASIARCCSWAASRYK